MSFQEEIHLIAKEYVNVGWFVIPLHSVNDDLSCTCGNAKCTDVGKHPVTPRGLKDGSRDLTKLEEWFGGLSLRNIGIVTGEMSNLTVLDIDMGKGKFGAETWVELTRERGEPDTLKSITGSGGCHILFLYNSALKTASNVLGKNVDCRNDCGYIVAPPSKHKSGDVYKWINWGTPLASLPAHLSQRKETRGRPRKDDLLRRRFSLAKVREMLTFVPADSRDAWRNFGIILGREFDQSDEAWNVYTEWAAKWDGVKGRGHDENMRQCFYEISQQSTNRELSVGTIVKAAMDNGWVPKTGDVPKEDFIFYAPEGDFLYKPTLSSWKAASVDVAVSPINTDGNVVKASEWLKDNRRATSLAHDPAIEEEFVHEANCVNGAIVEGVGAAVFNTYRRPTLALGDAQLAGPFVRHCQKLFTQSGDADQFLNYMAHRVQRPGEKPRFALLITGEQGIGKDTTVEFCVPAIGAWNVASIDPSALTERFNEYAAATLIRISETANLQEMSKWALNESMKVLIAGAPDFCIVNPKYGHKFTVRLHCGVLITTNHLLSSIFIPEDDRRYDVIECATRDEMDLANPRKRQDYFSELWEWFLTKEGARHVAAFLHERNLSGFSAASGQRKTAAHQTVVRCGMVGDEWVADIIEYFKNQDLVSGRVILRRAYQGDYTTTGLKGKLPHAMQRLGYVVFPNPATKDGRWKLTDRNGGDDGWHTIYRKRSYGLENAKDGWQKNLDG
jgi:hypothetical protein